MSARVGVLTLHRCINQGSYWQARCLVEGLRTLGHEAVILDHRSRSIDRAEWRCALRPTLPTPVPSSDVPAYRAKVLEFERANAQLPRSEPFDLDDPGALDEYGTIVVGSDEVWNLSHPWYAGSGLFFGEGIEHSRLVAHAATFGNHDASPGLASRWSTALGRFASISVRDTNSRSIVASAIGRQPELVIDPVLHFPPEPRDVADEPYVVVYGHNFSPQVADAVRRWARERGLETVSVSYRNDWADVQWLSAGPLEFERAIGRCRAVVTNFFHGTVFALARSKPFVCETSPYRLNKVSCLTSAVGATDHLVSATSPAEVIDRCLDAPLEAGITTRIDELRSHSSEHLVRALR